MTGAIYGKTIEAAKEQLNNIIYNYERCKIKPLMTFNLKHCSTVEFDNGDKWVAIPYTGFNTHAHRYNIIYIDHDISKDEQKLIGACANLPPYRGIAYF